MSTTVVDLVHTRRYLMDPLITKIVTDDQTITTTTTKITIAV